MSRILTVQQRSHGASVVLTVDGEVDMASAPVLSSALEQAQRDHPPLVVVDMSKVEFFGSAGMSVLIAASDAQPQALRVVPSYAVRRPIEVAALDQLLELFDTVEDALEGSPPIS
ncbi:MAG: putative anti-anti-sigma factor [Nocardia sp.]|uniref:STAS domain-containing protein n=1 Tax=Nocardia sp. TaxID=1821 RepID=UPI002634B6BA|nr:STAS domain-containing protein [Nocardia sp.]MCU1643065.1 putative anti-anti-sigma factor [Nocardia sp.]